jgi:hypothetical protein
MTGIVQRAPLTYAAESVPALVRTYPGDVQHFISYSWGSQQRDNMQERAGDTRKELFAYVGDVPLLCVLVSSHV